MYEKNPACAVESWTKQVVKATSPLAGAFVNKVLITLTASSLLQNCLVRTMASAAMIRPDRHTDGGRRAWGGGGGGIQWGGGTYGNGTHQKRA